MRTQLSVSRRGFTLIELLTVIAIIGILAGMLAVVVPLVKTKAKITTTKTAYSGWIAGIGQYKAAYSQYPFINNKYEASADTFHKLDSEPKVTEFIKCLTGKTPIWDGGKPLSTGPGGDARKYNKSGTEFVTFDKSSFEMDSSGSSYTKKLTDAFGNTNIRLVMDTDGNGMVRPQEIGGTPSDYGIDNQGNIGEKVIIYTLKSDNPAEYQDILSWQ